MPANCDWMDATKTIILVNYEGNWKWDEFFTVADKGRELANSVPHRVDYILDMRHGIQPSKGSTMTNSRTVMAKRAANSGIFVTLTTPFVKVMLNVFKNFDREHGSIMYAATSIDEAKAIIAKMQTKDIAKA